MTEDEMVGWHWVNFGSWWWTGRPVVLQSMGSQRVGHDWVAELRTPACQGPRGSLLRWRQYREAQTPKECSSIPSAIGSLLQLIFLPSVGNNGKQLEKTATNPTPHLFFCPVSEKSQDSYNFAETNQGLGQWRRQVALPVRRLVGCWRMNAAFLSTALPASWTAPSLYKNLRPSEGLLGAYH